VSIVRLGAVDYLNARPLVYGLELRTDLFALRFDPPSKCAALLHEGSIDVGMIPTIEYLRGPSYRIVPGMAITSEGIVESVAVYCRVPIAEVRTLAADTSSRTSAGLLKVLCYERFGIDPAFTPMAPDPAAMLAAYDAALVIGDPALFFDHEAAGVQKVDLGAEWTAMTGLPFVWAFWAGRAEALTRDGVAALAQARDHGVAASDELAAAYCGPGRAERGQAYLRENIQYQLGEREEAGLRAWFELAVKHDVAPATRAPLYYPS
jgi:chorismate dehydratase